MTSTTLPPLSAQELRINNLIKRKSTGEILTVDGGTIRCIESENSYPKFEGSYEGIPLTEDWLTKFGFSKIDDASHFSHYISLPYWVKEGLCLFYNSSPPYNTYLVGYADQRMGKYSVVTRQWIDKVHTLQNIYYAWRGTELTINP